MVKTLYDIKKGKNVKIIKFKNPEVKLNSSRFGIEPGQTVKLIEKFGNVVIQINQQQIAIGKKLSKEIIVEEVS